MFSEDAEPPNHTQTSNLMGGGGEPSLTLPYEQGIHNQPKAFTSAPITK